MIILSVDYGRVRTGIAVCDKREILASPVCTITEPDMKKLGEKIKSIAEEKRAEMIVLGLPRNMDGTEGESAQNVRSFAEILKEKTGLPVEFSDERGTTVTAHSFLNETDTRGKKRKAVVDAVAAVIILEDYLSFRRNNI